MLLSLLPIFRKRDDAGGEIPAKSSPAPRAPSADNDGREPTPLPSADPREAEYPLDALSPRARDAAIAIQRLTQAPAALCGQAVLGTVSLSVSSYAKLETLVRTSSCPAAVAVITVAESGERKTAVDKWAMGGVHALTEDLIEQNQADTRAYREQLATRSPGDPKPTAPQLPLFIASEPTLEGLVRVINNGPGFLGVLTDEGAQVFGSHAMAKENRAKTSAGLSRFWDGSPYARPRAKEDADMVVPACPTTINLMIQPVLLSESYGDEFLVGQGLLARILPCWPVSHIGYRPFRDADEVDLETVADFQAQTRSLVEAALKTRATKRVLPMSDAARQICREFHDEVEVQLQPGGRLADARGFAAKAAEHAVRLAGIQTLFEDLGAVAVGGETMAGSCELVRYHLAEFQHIRAAALADPMMADAEKLRAWLLKKGKPGDRFARELIQQNGPSSVRRNEALNRVLRILLEYGWIQPLSPGTIVNGKARKEAYRIHPKAGEPPQGRSR